MSSERTDFFRGLKNSNLLRARRVKKGLKRGEASCCSTGWKIADARDCVVDLICE